MLKVVSRHGSLNYYLRGTVRGISVDESTGTSNEQAANEIRITREAELLTESIHGKRAVVSFAQAALSYMEQGGEKTYIKPLLLHFGTKKLSAITQVELDEGARKIYGHCMTSTIIRQFYGPMSAIFMHSWRRGWCDKKPIDRPSAPLGRVRWITHEEADRLVSSCDDQLRPLVVFLLYTGARLSEALNLEWTELDLVHKRVEFLETKNGSARGVPLHSRIVTAFSDPKTVRNGRVFRTRWSKCYASVHEDTEDTAQGTRVRYQFAKACERAGITNFHPHDCRHTWATWHYRANRDLGALQKLGGWKTIQMVMRYAHTNVDELAATIERL